MNLTVPPFARVGDLSVPDVVVLNDGHLPDAAALFVAGYRAARQREPILPPRHEDATCIVRELRHLAQQQPGVAALRDGRVVGFVNIAWDGDKRAFLLDPMVRRCAPWPSASAWS